MGKQSTRENKNIYQLCREAQGLTREKASENMVGERNFRILARIACGQSCVGQGALPAMMDACGVEDIDPAARAVVLEYFQRRIFHRHGDIPTIAACGYARQPRTEAIISLVRRAHPHRPLRRARGKRYGQMVTPQAKVMRNNFPRQFGA